MTDATFRARCHGRGGIPLATVVRWLGESPEVVSAWTIGAAERAEWEGSNLAPQSTQASPPAVGETSLVERH